MSKLIVLLAVASVFGVGMNASGGLPSAGTYTYSAQGDTSLAAWDVSGTYDDNGSEGLIDGGFTLATDPSGKITGGGTASLSEPEYGVSLDMKYAVNGLVKTVKNLTSVQMSMVFSGRGSVDYDGEVIPYTVGGTFKYALTVDQDNKTIDGTLDGSMRVSARGYGSETISLREYNDGKPISFSTALPGDMDGSWNLGIQLGTDAKGKPVVAQATVTLSNGRVLNLAGKEAYNARKDLTTVTLTGSRALGSTGATLTLIGTGSEFDITACTGKLLGQTLK